ncbi:MarR family transcriptional regulator, partial [Streptomyces sp. NPDC002044]
MNDDDGKPGHADSVHLPRAATGEFGPRRAEFAVRDGLRATGVRATGVRALIRLPDAARAGEPATAGPLGTGPEGTAAVIGRPE